jgi:cytochrome b pre-mRNA-processing protein 3
MIRLPFLKPKPDPVAALYGDIVAVARAPVAYLEYGVADDFEGRFERLVLISTLVLRRMRVLPAPAAAMAQELADRLFSGLDDGLRRIGVSDIAVGKRMKKLAQGFYGRAEAYTAALDHEDKNALVIALARNLYGGKIDAEAVPKTALAEIGKLLRLLDEASLDTLLAGKVLHPHYDLSPRL